MQKITLVCLSSARSDAVRSLQRLGLFHVVPVNEPVSEELHELSRRQADLERVLNALSDLRLTPEAVPEQREPELILQRAVYILGRLKEVSERQAVLSPAIEQLEPWGEFSETVLQQLEAEGWHYALCRSGDELPQGLPENAFCQIVKKAQGSTCYIVVASEPLMEFDLPLEKFSQGRDLRVLRQELSGLREEETQLEQELRDIASSERVVLLDYAAVLQSRIDYASARDSMGHSGEELSWLSGFVPDENLPELLQAARSEGWGIRHEEAELEDPEVPTKLRIPKRLRMAQLIFDFIGVLPGYNEVDVSVPLLIFLSIFCGMLVGDAGYGLLFFAAGAVLWWKNRFAAEKKREAILLLLLMSGCILTFGALSGNWFGLPAERVPLFFRGIPWFRDDVNSNHVKLLGFVIGAFHLSMARIWAAIISRSLRGILGNVGWALFLWGNFFTVKMLLVSGGELPFLAKLFYLVGTVLILTCSVDWRDMGDIIYTPFNFINSLVDVLSYIRLYAVGLSGFFIAKSFNSMSVMVWESSKWMIPLGLIIILLGHSLNVALATMGVMVHGIRLNTLEFSGHIGLSWGGKAYQPLKKAQSIE